MPEIKYRLDITTPEIGHVLARDQRFFLKIPSLYED